MLSTKRKGLIEAQFNKLLPLFNEKCQEIMDGLDRCSENEEIIIKFLYTNMPLSDVANYPFETYLEYAQHGIYLWENGQYRHIIPEDIFLSYVLHHRINEEEITKCRQFFCDEIHNRIEGLSMKEAALEVNYWCAEEATYESTDDRTMAPYAVYQSGYGRCGEESTFTVAALRSVGIPARQVYAPKWSHTDDNHAWVEVWCEGEWYFMGACEPEEILNRGWFTSASSRAMLTHSRWFLNEMPKEDIISSEGKTTYLNQLTRYAKTKTISICVKDKNKQAVPGAYIDIEILNYSELFPVASLLTDENGNAKFTTGLGTLHLNIRKGSHQANKIIDTRDADTFQIELVQEVSNDRWIPFDVIAPVDSPVNTNVPTKEQKLVGDKKVEAANNKRLAKVNSFYLESEANEIINKRNVSEEIKEILKLSRGNFTQVAKFLMTPVSEELDYLKEDLLKSLTLKDYRDLKSEILVEHLQYSAPYINDFDKDIFVLYLLNPRVYIEPLSLYREYINQYYSKTKIDALRENPKLIWEDINDEIKEQTELENINLITSPVGCLKIKAGSFLSKKVLFVAVCRTLGIPARLNKKDLSMEYYKDGKFNSVIDANEKTGILMLSSKDQNKKWNYFSDWSLAILKDGRYKTLDLSGESFSVNNHNSVMSLDLKSGDYRIITSNRLPNGNIFSYKYHFTLEEKETKNISLEFRNARLSDMLENIDIPDFELSNEDGTKVNASEIAGNNKNIFIWIEESKEPSEHILNEMYELKDEFKYIKGQIVFVLQDVSSLNNPTIARTLNVIPNIKIYYDESPYNTNLLGRRMYVDPDKLPLIISTKSGLTGVYATSGYNVGTADMLLRINEDID